MSARAATGHWLVKTEPGSYSIHDLERDGRTSWDGVRNYQARNLLRDGLKPGDPVLVYHSSAEPPCVAGLARVAGAAHPDPTQFDARDEHFDPKARREAPTWISVDLEHVETFATPIPRSELLADAALEGMVLLQRGSRLSVQPVTAEQFRRVVALARRRRGART